MRAGTPPRIREAVAAVGARSNAGAGPDISRIDEEKRHQGIAGGSGQREGAVVHAHGCSPNADQHTDTYKYTFAYSNPATNGNFNGNTRTNSNKYTDTFSNVFIRNILANISCGCVY